MTNRVTNGQWDTSVHSIELINRLDNLQVDRSLDHSRELDLDRGLGLEL